MRRGIARVSLFLAALFLSPAYAVPWREKNAFRIATSLPAKLIDSIMARGNWNILFQEGPFAEFQRQIAIANHFVRRGDIRQANFYFEKAGNALDIAYGSFRGRFGWPRNYTEMRASALPWGENRETFEDFLLCRLQLHLESMLAEHESGILRTESLDGVVAGAEKQLGTQLRQKDADLDQLITFVRAASVLRNARELDPAAAAGKFAALSDKVEPSVKNYWNRRLNLFRIFENIHYGNLGRSEFLAHYLEERQKDHIDPMVLARIYIHTLSFDDAYRLLNTAIIANETRVPENFSDYQGYSAILQNLLIWLRRYEEAEKISTDTQVLFQGFIRNSAVPREELVDLKKSFHNEALRAKMYTYLKTGKCPEPGSFTGETDMEPEWQIRERIFFEKCRLPRDRKYWAALLKNPSLSADGKSIAAYFTGDDRIFAAALKQKPSALVRHLAARRALEQGIANNQKGKIAELTGAYLRTLNHIHADFVLFDWGFSPGDSLVGKALGALPATLPEKQAKEIFTGLHQRFAAETREILSQRLFSPGDATMTQRLIAGTILDLPVIRVEEGIPPTGGKSFVYADAAIIASWEGAGKKTRFRLRRQEDIGSLAEMIGTPSGGVMLFGGALAEMIGSQNNIPGGLVPLHTFCNECRPLSEKTPERLIVVAGKQSPWQSIKNELADNFSLVPELAQYRDCSAGLTEYDDTVVLTAEPVADFRWPCNLKPEKIIVEYEGALPATGIVAAHAMGWRRGLCVVMIPRALPTQIKTSLLFDFFQRTNRRQARNGDALREAKARAEKSFPSEPLLQGVYVYESQQ